MLEAIERITRAFGHKDVANECRNLIRRIEN
jgi:superfamily II helicase